MERDTFHLSWWAAPRLNAALIALVILVGLPCLWIAFDVVQLAVDAVASGDAAPATSGHGAPASAPADVRQVYLRYAIQSQSGHIIVFLPGISLTRAELPAAIALCLAALGAMVAALWWAFGALTAQIGRRVATVLADRILLVISSAPIPAAEEARRAAFLAGEALGRERQTLGLGAVAPLAAGAVVAVSVGYVVTHSVEMGLALLVGLLVYSLITNRQARLDARLHSAQRSVSDVLRRALSDLAQHLSAVVAHGTRLTERGRIKDQLKQARLPVERLDRKARTGSALALALLFTGPLGVLAAASRVDATDLVTPGGAAASLLAASVAVASLAVHLGFRRALDRSRPLYADIARALGTCQARRFAGEETRLPASGVLLAEGAVTGTAPTGRLNGVDLKIPLPDHVALCGGRDSGARTFAGLLGGQLPRTAGRLEFGGVELTEVDPAERAKRLAFAGGASYLFAGSLRANLLYGAPEGKTGDVDELLVEAIRVAGLDRMVELRGLSGSVDARRQPKLAESIVAARRTIWSGLEARGLSDLIDRFDPEGYNHQATIGENILFGVALGDTFRIDRLPSQAYLKGLLDADGLVKPLAAIGASIARSDLELFAGLPERNSLVGRFAMVPASERDRFNNILIRRDEGRRGAGSARDDERLIGLALQYCEKRHRLGLLGPDLEARIVRIRLAFSSSMPPSLQPAIQFFHPDRVCAAASVRDNLLFGRIIQDRADAERDVVEVVRAVLAEIDLVADVSRVGLSTRVDPVDPKMTVGEIAAIDLVRCLVRKPDTIVVEHALEALGETEAPALVQRLQAALAGRGLMVVIPEMHESACLPLFPTALRFHHGRVVREAPAAASDAPRVRIAG
ncbi:hypothetical protein [uncultured Enterovirga sp.]|uniref:hypothetical protein n=1 Tax=uncultured Enterovirga sp. TaxID=2026352 RepID=UPI0035CBF998